MKKLSLFLFSLFLGLPLLQAQERGFVLKGCVPGMKDGVNVALLSEEDSLFAIIAETKIKDGCFELRGKVKHPIKCTMTTNNLDMVEQNKWSMDSVYWTYTPVFVDNVEMKVETDHYKNIPSDWGVTPAFRIVGGEVQTDYTALERMRYEAAKGEVQNLENMEFELIWKFILSHPHSVVSVYHANRILQRGYNLTLQQVEQLDNAITDVSADPERFALFKERIQYAKQTTVGGSLVDLELADVQGNVTHLSEVVPKGKFVLVDFWASWCGMCLYAMPQIKELEGRYRGDLVVIAVSCDQNLKAWKSAMEKKNMPWPQYVLTKQGYDDFFHKYQVGNGVPYYTLIAPDGKVMKAPSGPDGIEAVLKHFCK